MIQFDDFKKVEIRVAKVISCERVEGSEKLLKLIVDCGDKDEANLPAVRQVLAGVGKVYTPEEMIGRQIIVVANLQPRMMMGLESQGMLLAADSPEGPVLLCPDKEVVHGAEIR